MREAITTSIFDIFKIGPGPSSSHTIGPMKAALAFRQSVEALPPDTNLDPAVIDVYLYGSLSLTGEGHGTHKAVLGGLLGWHPETCDCDQLLTLLLDPETVYEIPLRKTKIPFAAANIHFEGLDASLPFSNTLRFKISVGEKALLQKEYYSIGGGFIKCKGEEEPARPEPPYPYHDMRGLRQLLRKNDLSLREVLLENEAAITGMSRDDILGQD